MAKVLLSLTFAILLAFATAAAETASTSGLSWWATVLAWYTSNRSYAIGITTFAIFSWIFLKCGSSVDTVADTANDDKEDKDSSSSSNQKGESIKEAASVPIPPAPKVEKKKVNVSPAKKRAISPGKKGK